MITCLWNQIVSSIRNIFHFEVEEHEEGKWCKPTFKKLPEQ